MTKNSTKTTNSTDSGTVMSNPAGVNELSDMGLIAARARGDMHDRFGPGPDGERRTFACFPAASYLDALLNASHDQLHGFEYGRGARVDGLFSRVADATTKRMELEETDPQGDSPKTVAARKNEEMQQAVLEAAIAIHKRLICEWTATQDDDTAVWESRKVKKAASEKARQTKADIEAELKAKLGA